MYGFKYTNTQFHIKLLNKYYYNYYQYGPLIIEFNTIVTYKYRCGLLIIIPINIEISF